MTRLWVTRLWVTGADGTGRGWHSALMALGATNTRQGKIRFRRTRVARDAHTCTGVGRDSGEAAFMKKALMSAKLLLPVLFPSWRFFDVIGPSPRVEFSLLPNADDDAGADHRPDWQEFRPRPECLSFGSMLRRMLWNPRWNESLYLVTCAERMIQNPSEHSGREIRDRIRTELHRIGSAAEEGPFFRFRLVFMSRLGTEIRRDVIFESPIYPISESAAS